MIRTLGEHGRVRSIEERFAETLDWLAHTIHHPIDGRPGLLFRATLLASSFLSTHGLPELFRESPDMTLLDGTHAVGVLDLVRVSYSPDGVRLEVGDIKDSAVPHLSGKWRVAFHALLLQDWPGPGTSSPDLPPLGYRVPDLAAGPGRPGTACPYLRPASFPCCFSRSSPPGGNGTFASAHQGKLSTQRGLHSLRVFWDLLRAGHQRRGYSIPARPERRGTLEIAAARPFNY